MLASQRQFIAAAARMNRVTAARYFCPECSPASSIALRVSLVNLQKFTLLRMRGRSQHFDIRAGTEYPLPGRAQHHRLDLRMLEAQPLDGVIQFDIDAEIVGIQF